MKLCVIVSLLATTACCALGFQIAPPPQIQSGALNTFERFGVKEQLEKAVVASGLTADASASISTGFFNRVLADIDQYINTIGTSIVIPGETSKHYGFSDIHFQQFNIGAIDITTSAPNKIVVSISNVDIKVPDTDFHVKADALIHCAGKFSVDIQGGNFIITLTMGNGGNGHITTVASVTTSYAKLDVSHKFDHFLCKIANDIIDALVGNIDKLIDNVIKNDLPAKLGPAMTKSFDELFTKIPLYFTGTPTIVNQGISVTVDLLASTAGFPTAMPYTQRIQNLKDYSHDITIDVPQNSMNNILVAAQAAGKLHYDLKLKETTKIFDKLIPTAYSACPDCNLGVALNLPLAPTVTFATNDVDAAAERVNVAINAINNSTGAVVPLFNIIINVTLDVDSLTIRTVTGGINNLYFQLNLKTLSIALSSSSIGPLPQLNVIIDLLTYVVQNLAIPAFNDAFQGFDFPSLFGGAAVSSLNGLFEFETNILLPPIQAQA